MGIHGHWDQFGILSREEHDEAKMILDEFATIIDAEISTRSSCCA